MKAIFFDLEGPLTPQDNAFELMLSFPQGGQLFAAISRYDDLLALAGQEGYEPGTTLALIVPFLLYHGLTEADMRRLGQSAPLTPGAAAAVAQLAQDGWQTFAISTSYRPFAQEIARRVGLAPQRLACTPVPLDQMRASLREPDLTPVARLEPDLLRMAPDDDRALRARLDAFYHEELLGTPLGAAVRQIKPVGGGRKVAALEGFASSLGLSLGEVVAVGDSITDCRMLEAVSHAGGLAVAFNANHFALPCATMGLASPSLLDLLVVTRAWELGGREGAEGLVRVKESLAELEGGAHFHWLEGRSDLTPIIELHQEMRRHLRHDAASLG